MATSVTPLDAFRHAYFSPIDQYLAWHDGYEADPAYLTALSATERVQAEQELLAALRTQQGDARAVLGLSYLRSEEALPLLHQCLRQNRYVHYALTAIAAITPARLDRTLLRHVLLEKNSSASHLIDVLLGLHDSFTLLQVGAEVARAVLDRFTHPDYLVRYHALNALRSLYGVPAPSDIHHDTLFGLICRKWAPSAYRRAHQLFISQVATNTLHQFPLTDRATSNRPSWGLALRSMRSIWRRWLGGK